MHDLVGTGDCGPSNITIDHLSKRDQSFLWDMLYEAIYVPHGAPRLPREILDEPGISRYAQNWGQENDVGFVATDIDNLAKVGAAWLRLLTGSNRGYGYVNDCTPELSLAVKPAYRGRGVGSALMRRTLEEAEQRYEAISLSVSSHNPAVRLYRRFGFRILCEVDGTFTMLKILRRA